MKRILSFCISFFIAQLVFAQNKIIASVDKNGIIRWQHSKEEIRGFGANYTLPFAYAYRNAVKKGLNPEKLIDEDVYHFARLGFDLFRVHVWDTEISDSAGNLLQNEHLRLFDYLLMRLKERNIRCIITPIAFWGNGWPEPDTPSPGFAHKYGKDACLTHPDAIRAQQNYLAQFLNHVNPYTGIAYKSEDQIIAFEVSNEPHHRASIDSVRSFIQSMVSAMRKTGTRKPILYNISHSVQSADAYFSSGIQGGTFQWYPTGLGAGHELGGNLLPHVDQYTIPYATDPRFKSMAKIVYEFDAADVGRSYIYPAMARSLRSAGLQVATHFAYDPTYSAYANTEYGTHYMNLLYTPQKALSLKIAAEVFRRIPMYKNYGTYPLDTVFDAFRVSYREDLAEMITEEKFFYTNHSSTLPPNAEQLKEVAGWGNSAVVSYGGTGAYFLDKIDNGLWRLELMPDAVWVNDPFGKTSLDKKVGVLQYHRHTMKIMLPDLGSSFSIAAIAEQQLQEATKANNGTALLQPGVYLLSRTGDFSKANLSTKIGSIGIAESIGKHTQPEEMYVIHHPPVTAAAAQELHLTATIAAPEVPQEVILYVQTPGRWFEPVKMEAKGFHYEAILPAEKIEEGLLRYHIIIKMKDKIIAYTGAHSRSPMQWDYTGDKPYAVPVMNKKAAVTLFNAATDSDQLLKEWRKGSQMILLDDKGKAAWKTVLETLEQTDPEYPAAVQPADYSMRYFFGKKVADRKLQLLSKTMLELEAWTAGNEPMPLQVALVNKDGIAYGTIVMLQPDQRSISIPLKDLKPVPLVTLPRPYPGFMPYYFMNQQNMAFNPAELESIQFSVGPGITNPRQPVSFYISSAALQ